jgi:hypothetical protein
MELAAGPPAHWIVSLTDGREVDIWADSVTGLTEKTAEDERIVFGNLMDIDPEHQSDFDVTARTPTNNRRVVVVVARFERLSVRDVRSVG